MPFPFIRKAYKAVKKMFKGRRRVVVAKKMRARYNKGQVLHVKKVVRKDRVQVPGNATLYAVDSFELSDLPQKDSYKQLYEEYKIKKIVVKYVSLTNISSAVYQAGSIPFTSLGMIHTTVDTNDDTLPTSIDNMMNDSTYRGTVSSRNHTRVIYPKALADVGSQAVNPMSGWIKCEADNVSHYGIKLALQGGSQSATTATTSYIIEPIITYYVCFRNPK